MNHSILVVLAITTLALAAPAGGQTLSPLSLVEAPAETQPTSYAPDDDTDWDFSLSVPIWLVGFDGDLEIRGNELTVDDGEGDVDFLDSDLNGAFALRFEAQHDRVGLMLDAMYLERVAEGTLDLTDAEGELKGFVGELGAFWTILPPEHDARGFGALRVDVLGGLRVSALELSIHADDDSFDADANRTFYDPFVGARLQLGLTDWLSFKLRGDVGGFGIESWPASDLSYNVDTRLEFHLAEWFDLGVGYRWLDYDFEGKSDSSLDATLSGPVVELKFNF